MKKALLLLLLAFALSAQPATRTVTITWSNPNPSGSVLGTTISVGTSPTGPFTQIGCVGSVTGSSCVSGSNPVTPFTDPAETIGTTVYYSLQFIGTVCAPGQSTPCGNSASAVSSAVPIPARSASPGSLTIIVN